MAIRYNRKTNQSIYRAVKNFNAKITRLYNKGYDINLDKVSTKEIKAMVNTRKELELYLRELQAFSKRGSEVVAGFDVEGNEIYKYHEDIREIQRQRAVEVVKQEVKFYSDRVPTVRGKKQDGTLKQMGSSFVKNRETTLEALQKKSFKQKLTAQEEKFLISMVNRELNKQEKAERFYGSFMQILWKYGGYCGVESSKLREINEALLSIKPDKFVQMYNTESIIKHIMNLYQALQLVYDEESKQENINEGKMAFDELHSSLMAIFKDYQE